MGIKIKILFSILIVCAVTSVTALSFFAMNVEGSTPTYPFIFSSSGYECSTYDQCYDYCVNVVPGSESGDGFTCDEYFSGAIDSSSTGDPCGSYTCATGDFCANYDMGWCCPIGTVICDNGRCVNSVSECPTTDVSCGSNVCVTGYYCADIVTSQCCPDGTVPCSDGSCMYSASECPTTDNCGPDQHWDPMTSSCVYDGTNCGPDEYWDSSTNSCVIDSTSTTCPIDQHWDPATNSCIYDGGTATDCEPDGYWDSATNSCVYDGSTGGVACGTNNHCTTGDFCANYDMGWCCPIGTVICDNGKCVNSASECSTTDNCGPDQHWDSMTGTCVYDGTNCGPDEYWDPATNSCIYDNSTGTTCGTGCYWDTSLDYCVCDDTVASCDLGYYWDSMSNSCVADGTNCGVDHYWDSNTNSCVYDGTMTCGPNEYWDSDTNTCVYNGTDCGVGYYWDSYTNSCVADGTNCGPDHYWDPATNSCIYDENMGTCGPNEYWDSSTNTCVYSGTTCGPDHYWDPATDTCVYDENMGTCGPDSYWDSVTDTCIYSGTASCGPNDYWDDASNTCVYSGTTCDAGYYWDNYIGTCVADGSTGGVACGTNNHCATGDFCANYDMGWCCPIGTVICDNGKCVNSASECSTTDNCGPDSYWDPATNSCIYDGNTGTNCGSDHYWDPVTDTCVYDDNIGTCGPDSYWDPATNSCIYKDKYCEPDHYWDDMYDTCKSISSENDIVYTITEKDIIQGPGGCQSREECDAYCSDPVNAKECVEFAVDSGFMSPEEAESVLLMLEKDITQGPGGCQSKEACDAYCGNPANTEECVNFAVKTGFMSQEEADRIMAGGPGGCQSKEACDAYCVDPANMEECVSFAVEVGFMSQEEAEKIMMGGPGGCQSKEECDAYCSDPVNKEECVAFAKENDIFKEEPKMVSPSEIKTVLEKVTEPAKCETELECKIYCSSADANKELCQTFSMTVIVEDKVRSITEFIDDAKVEEALFQSIGPGDTSNIEDVHAYCSDPTHYEECQKFVSEKELLSKEVLDEKIDELEKKRIEKERMFAERIGSRIYEDSDGDGVSDYDELNIFHTDPNLTDTDGDGIADGAELLMGKDPLSGYSVATSGQPIAAGTDPVGVEDGIVYEDPKIAGEEKPGLVITESINVLGTEMSDDGIEKTKKVSFAGKAPSNSFVTVYIYSTPIIVTVKTDEQGNWVYELDKELEDGDHEVYVAITDNAGKIYAKSKPLPFVKEAAAVTIDQSALFSGGNEDPSVFERNYLYLIGLLIIVIVGWVLVFTRSKQVQPEEIA